MQTTTRKRAENGLRAKLGREREPSSRKFRATRDQYPANRHHKLQNIVGTQYTLLLRSLRTEDSREAKS